MGGYLGYFLKLTWANFWANTFGHTDQSQTSTKDLMLHSQFYRKNMKMAFNGFFSDHFKARAKKRINVSNKTRPHNFLGCKKYSTTAESSLRSESRDNEKLEVK